MSAVLESEWLEVEVLRVGRVPATLGTPGCYVTVTENDAPTFRVDVYPYEPDCFAFQDAVVWRDNLAIGFGSRVHAISVADRSVNTIALEEYFGHLYPTRDYLLLASGARLFRMEPDRSILWKSEPLAPASADITLRSLLHRVSRRSQGHPHRFSEDITASETFLTECGVTRFSRTGASVAGSLSRPRLNGSIVSRTDARWTYDAK